ncbi:L-fucose permease [Talaromyces islandicus]|uniref:L-fucose permease n=1 Tax=Talaromyces islandicus TaxID=28573 RepID=A0A0U1M2Z8_TALIS|nr:L-fucose permease [Talaromyces islandicus]
MPLREKVLLLITFGVAILVIVIDVIRIAFLENTATSRLRELHTAKVGEIPDEDYTWFAAISFMLSAVEVNMTITCACVPSMKPLAARLRLILVPSPREASQPSDSAKESSSQSANRGDVPTTSRSEGATVEMMDVLTHRITSEAEMEEGEKTDITEARGNMTFVNLLHAKPANMLKLDNKESCAPNALISTIFFLWGFAYGPLNVLNKRFATVTDLSQWESLGLHAAFDGGYLLGPLLVGRLVLKRFGCAATFITGLYVYGCGTLLFWPAGVLGSTPTFLVSNFVIGCGLGILETTANMFMALCGPLEYSEIRLCVAHAFEATGGLCAQLLSTRVWFKDENSVTQVVTGQWTFFALAFCDVVLAVVFYYLPIPEVPDDDLEEISVWSQYFYVAGQEMHNLSYSFSAPTAFNSIASASFIGGRLLAALVIWLFMKPRWTLLISYIGMIVFSILRMNTTGTPAIAMGALIWTLEGGAFPIIYGIALRGTGRHTKTASALLAAAISGGLFFPFIKHSIQVSRGEAYSYCLVVAVFCAGAIFPLYLNLLPRARRQVDPIKGEYLHRR